MPFSYQVSKIKFLPLCPSGCSKNEEMPITEFNRERRLGVRLIRKIRFSAFSTLPSCHQMIISLQERGENGDINHIWQMPNNVSKKLYSILESPVDQDLYMIIRQTISLNMSGLLVFFYLLKQRNLSLYMYFE